MRGYEPHVHGEIKHCHRYDTDPQKVFKDRSMRAAGMTPGARHIVVPDPDQ